MTAAEAARGHLHALATAGVEAVTESWLDGSGACHYVGKNCPLAKVAEGIDRALEQASRIGSSLVIRPRPPASATLLQLDDVPEAAFERALPLALFGLETSPGSRQAWLALAGAADAGLARAVKAATGADRGASGACRLAGSINFKGKYRPDFPVVRLLAVQPGRFTGAGELVAAGLLPGNWAGGGEGAPRFSSFLSEGSPGRPWRWPDYERALAGAPRARSHPGRDRSMADFFWCCLAVKAGWRAEEVAEQLMAVSERARERGRGYASGVAARAAASTRK